MTALDPAARDSIKLFAHGLDSTTIEAGRIIAEAIVEKHQEIDTPTLAHIMSDALMVVQQTGADSLRTLAAVVYDLVLRGGEAG